ncbi:hypothetical protein [Paludisphaera rhizosphaerae]|uniref:hypothetical protein n=1 Tax=Paludisphaera rhizosphaerae TaxID=2711216 RepID=UPI0013EC2BBB|nr:hypothetical protein [Paludisphaera rhizosphaerae]
MPALPPRVKIFAEARAVVIVAIVKNVGRITVAPNQGTVTLSNDPTHPRAILRSVIRKLSLGPGSKHSILIAGLFYADHFGKLSKRKEKVTFGDTADIDITVTNTPPGSTTPSNVTIHETAVSVDSEPNDVPNPLDDFLFSN